MNRRNQYRELMEQIRDAHQEFSRVWNEVRASELNKRGIDSVENLVKTNRYEKLWEANGVAYKKAQPYSDMRDQYSVALYEVIPFKEFDEGHHEAIDAVIDFLEVNVLAFGCGYVKQECLHTLKRLPLDDEQSQRLRRLMVDMCQWKGNRRELRELARLMIRLADKSLIEDLRKLVSTSENKYTRRKAERALQIILNGRHDLG